MTHDSKSGDVIALSTGTDQRRDAHLPAFVQYWQSMRKMGDVPRRSDIDPRGIEALLEHALIAERIAPGLARMRIAGSGLADLLGMEVRGMPLSAFVTPEDRTKLAEALTELFERPAIVDIELRSDGGRGQPPLTGRLLLMPLRSDLGDVSRALGCLVISGDVGKAPRRFSITRQTITRVELPADGRLAQGFEEAPTPFEERKSDHPAERPYLRVVK